MDGRMDDWRRKGEREGGEGVSGREREGERETKRE